MTLTDRLEAWLRLANTARYRGRHRLANYAMRRMRRALLRAGNPVDEGFNTTSIARAARGR